MNVPYNFKFTYNLVEVESVEMMASQECFVIQVYMNSQIYHDGDERSRTSPGHGYPAYTENRLTIRQFLTINQTDWKNAIKSLYDIDPKLTDVVAFSKSKSAQVLTNVEVN